MDRKVLHRISLPHILAALVIAVLVLFAPTAPALAADDVIRVTVTDAGSPLAGVGVEISGDSGTQTGTTDDKGQVEIAVPGTGTYEITVDASTLPDGVDAPSSPMTYDKVSSGKAYAALKLDEISQSAQPSVSSSPASSASTSTGSGNTSTSTSTGSATTTDDGSATGEDTTSGSFGQQLAAKLIRGVVYGLILALASIGVSLIYGTTGLNNFAHGELVTFGGFVAYTAMTAAAFNGWVAIVLALILGAAFGWLQNAVIWHPLRKKRVGLIQIMIVSIGLALFLRYLYAFFFGPNRLVMPQSFDAVWSPFGVSLSYWDLWGSVIALVIILAMVVILERTRLGKSIRAVADNKLLAATTGIHVERVIRVVWVGGAAIAAVAGVLVAFYQTLSFNSGAQILLLIFAAVTLGGLGSAYGALVGAILLSCFIELSTFFIPSSMKTVAAMLVMILILLVRPQGIFGSKQRIG